MPGGMRGSLQKPYRIGRAFGHPRDVEPMRAAFLAHEILESNDQEGSQSALFTGRRIEPALFKQDDRRIPVSDPARREAIAHNADISVEWLPIEYGKELRAPRQIHREFFRVAASTSDQRVCGNRRGTSLDEAEVLMQALYPNQLATAVQKMSK